MMNKAIAHLARRVLLPVRSVNAVCVGNRLPGTWLMALALAMLAMLAGSAVAATVSDDFSAGTYSGGSGWAGNWTEIGDDNSTAGGDVRIVSDLASNRLRIGGASNGIYRNVNLSGALTAVLSFDYRRVALDAASDYVAVEISTNGGTGWVEVGRIAGPTNDAGYTAASYDITSYAAANTQLRFYSASSLGNTDYVYIDNVLITYTPAPSGGGTQPILTCGTTLTAGGIINTYHPGVGSIAAGATAISVGTATGAAQAIAPGDMLLIMQMQDASINSTNTGAYGDGVAGDPATGATTLNNAGYYEYVTASSAVTAGVINITSPTTRAYTSAAATGTQGQRTFQVIRVPVFAGGTLVSGLTARPWDGSTGGVLALDVMGALALGGAIVDVSGLGFRGAAACQYNGGAGTNTDYRTAAPGTCPTSGTAGAGTNGPKAEGVAGTSRYSFTKAGVMVNSGVDGYPNGGNARGAPGNAGGGGSDGNPAANDQNTGGGGGGNGGAGGQGGWAWIPSGAPKQTGGHGGSALAAAVDRLFLGGGGGAGSVNNNTGTPVVLSSSGSPGGGIVMLRAGSLSGSAQVFAKGVPSNSTTGNDGSGGGGAGGSVLISAPSGLAGLSIDVSGGAGGSNSGGGVSHGPGGGGGGGVIVLSAVGATTRVAGALNGMTATAGGNGTTYPAAYGSTPGLPGILLISGGSGIPGSALPTSCSIVNHFAISHGGTGVNCQAENVTVTAHDALHASVSMSSGTSISITTSSGHGDWSLVSGLGTLTNLGNGNATYVSGAESSFVLALKDTFPETTNINVNAAGVTENSGSSVGGHDPNLTFAPSGFRFVDAGYSENITTQTAGVASGTYYLQGIRTDTVTGACVAAFGAGQTVNIDLAFQCQNPVTCQPGQQVSFTNNAISTALAANPAAGISSYVTVPVTFLNDGTSRATFSFSYPDVGQLVLAARYNIPLGSGGASPNYMLGTSNAFVVKPAGFVLSNITQTAAPNTLNPAAVDASGAKFVKAGENFSVTVTAVNANGVATPNYGKEIVPEGVKLTSALVGGLGLTHNPALNNSAAFGSFAGGVATGITFSWDEVGIITLTPSVADGDYLGAGNKTGTASGNVGRFYPNHFAVSGTSLSNRTDIAGCAASTFSYMGEPFRLGFTLSAQSAGGAILQNYAGPFAKLNLAMPASFNFGAVDGATNLTGRLDLSTPSAGSWGVPSPGTAAVTATLALNRAAVPDGPFSALNIGIAPQDSDGVQLLPAALNLNVDGVGGNDHAAVGATDVRFGRLRLSNAYGSELLDLPVNATLQYWNGSAFVRNAADTCTTFSAGDFTLSNYQQNLQAGETGVSISGGLPANLQLTRPGAGNYGSVDLSLNLAALGRAYLQGAWTGSSYNQNPSARVKFGAYRGAKEIIYFRENY